MKKLGTVIVLVLVLSNCGNYSWYQKITGEVETPEGLKTGYSVSKANGGETDFVTKSFTGYAFQSGASGETVVVELPGGRYLFAVLFAGPFRPDLDAIARNVFDDRLPQKGIDARYKALSKLRESRPVRSDMYPLLVTFTDLNNPASVRKVDPKNLAASFGPGYALKSIMLEITDEPVTKGKVGKLLGGWLDEYHNKHLDGRRYGDADAPNRLANSLASGDFKVGNW